MSEPRNTSQQLSDLELFDLNAGMSLDERGRLKESDGVTIASASEGGRMFIGDKIPDPLADELRTAFSSRPPGGDPPSEPEVVSTCHGILEARIGSTTKRCGPYYVIPRGCSFISDVLIETSVGEAPAHLRAANPGNWEADEWGDLLDNSLHGPWAMAVVGDRVVSICHTPRPMSPDAAECGTWTDPEFRGRGYAAATVVAWAAILEPTGRQLFYSTDSSNLSSQRVAERLGLRLIGWTWNLEPSSGEAPT